MNWEIAEAEKTRKTMADDVREVADLHATAEIREIDANEAYQEWQADVDNTQLEYDWECADAAKRWAWDAYFVAKADLEG